jgi:hypothetical protein
MRGQPRTRRWCPACERLKDATSFRRDEPVCRRCAPRRPRAETDAETYLAAVSQPTATVPLGAGRVLSVARHADTIVITTGLERPRTLTPGLESTGRVHLPMRALSRLRRALQRL